MARDYSAEYRRRQEKAQRLGFSSYAERRKALERAEKKRGFPDRRTLAGKPFRGESKTARALRDGWVALTDAQGLEPGDKIPTNILGDWMDALIAQGGSPREFFAAWYK